MNILEKSIVWLMETCLGPWLTEHWWIIALAGLALAIISLLALQEMYHNNLD